jgi:uncharacterized protein YdaU (DUF1376 family)
MANAWFPFYWGDYVIDTTHLSLQEHGAYLKLLGSIYTTAKPLPANAEQLHRICSCQSDEERSAVDFVVSHFFTLRRGKNGGYVQDRAMKEIEKQQVISQKRSASAKQKQSKSSANAQQLDTHLHPHLHKEKKKKGAIAPVLPDWLDKDAWNTWVDDRKERGKKLTKAAIAKQLKFLEEHKADHAAILDQAVRNGWTGLWPLNGSAKPNESVRVIKDFPL